MLAEAIRKSPAFGYGLAAFLFAVAAVWLWAMATGRMRDD